jgi:FkbM family methyltransferase
MITELFEYRDIKAHVRPGTSDSFVVTEVFSGEYNKLNIQHNDIVVDFGLNIGMFTIFALKKGAAQVWAYEPDPDNFSLASQNVLLNTTILDVYSLNNTAVVGNDDVTRDFSINVHKNKGAHSLVKKRGRETITVQCENINTILERARPTIVKMDIEGGELECLPAVKDWSGINQFIMEFHHAHLNDKDHKLYNETLDLLRKHFPHVEARADTKGAWVNIVYCHR